MGAKSSALFEEGDHVVVVGTTLINDGPATKNMTIASVIGVGSQELFLKCSKTQRIFKRPKLNCYRIPRELDTLSPLAVRQPILGDFVLSYSGGRFTQDKKVIGILIEIIDTPPNDVEARILCGEETHVVPLRSVIVVEGIANGE